MHVLANVVFLDFKLFAFHAYRDQSCSYRIWCICVQNGCEDADRHLNSMTLRGKVNDTN
jgi:hypothetical protein